MEQEKHSNNSNVTIHCENEKLSKENVPLELGLTPLNNNIFSPLDYPTNKDKIKSNSVDKDKEEDLGTSVVQRFIPKAFQKYAGILFTLIASLLLSHATLLVKILNGPEYGFHSYTSSFWRYLGVVIPALPLISIIEFKRTTEKRESVFATVWPLALQGTSEKWLTVLGLFVRGVLGASSVILRYYALQYLTIGDTSTITYATPVLVNVMAHFCLGEKTGVVPMLAAIMTFCGVVAMTRPPFLTGEDSFDKSNLIGISLACGSLICSSLIVIITRKIRNVHFSLMTLVFGIIGVVQAFILTQIFHVFQFPTNLYDTIFILALMSLAFFGQMAIILALTCEQAGPVALVRCCDVIFGFTLQFIFLGVIPDSLSAIGGSIVLICVAIIGVRKWLSTLTEDNTQRRRLKFLLI